MSTGVDLDSLTAVEEHCYTQNKVVKINYTWTIENFTFCRDKLLKSSTFPAGGNHKLKWCLEAKDINMQYLSLFLRLVKSCNGAEVRVQYKLSILNKRLEKKFVLLSPFIEISPSAEDKSWGSNQMCSHDTLLNNAFLLPENKLKIFCEVCIIEDSFNISVERFKVPECKLLDDFGNLFDNKKFSDVTLAVGGREIQAHKAILAARSPVFAAMFEQMDEKKLNRVTITDVDYELLNEILRFIYMGKVSNLEKTADDLIAAADKYALEKLKIMCEQALFVNLSVETAAEILILADRHSADQLKAQTIYFINKRQKDIVETVGWNKMLASYPHLISEIFRAQQNPQIEPNEQKNVEK